MAEANARIARVDAWLIPGLGRTIAITNANGTNWPADTFVHFGPLSATTGEVVPTIAAVTAAVVGPVATITLTEANVAAILAAYPHTGVARCPWHIRTGTGATEVAHATGYLGWDLTGSDQSATAVATVIVGPQGPTAVSADIGNAAELGTDGLLFVSPTAGSAHVIKNEGVALTNRAALNFAGAGVTVTDDAGNGATLVTIPSGGATTLDALTDVATAGQSTGKALVFDGSGWVPSSAATVLNGDSRLSDARTPTAHKVSHATGGTDALTPADIGAQPAGSYSLTSHNHTGTYAPALGADDNYVTDAEKTKLANLSGTNTGDQTLPTWSTIAGKPAVVAEGATAADARTAIGAGTLSAETLPASLVDAKGDLIVATAADTVARLAVGATTGHVLTVDPAETTGLKWAAAAGGGGGSSVFRVPAGRWVHAPGLGSMGDASGSTMTAGQMNAVWMPVDHNVTVTKIGSAKGGGASGMTLRAGIYADTGRGLPGSLVSDAGVLAADGASGSLVWADLSIALTPGLYWLVFVAQGTATSYAMRGWGISTNGARSWPIMSGATDWPEDLGSFGGPGWSSVSTTNTGELPASFGSVSTPAMQYSRVPWGAIFAAS